MYGPIFSVLLMGMVPVWGLNDGLPAFAREMRVAPPASAGPQLEALDTRLTASGVIIVDLDSGQTVYERNADIPRPMASLTKLMTALIIIENHDLDELVIVPSDIENVDGTVAHLPPNQKFTVGDLLSALLIVSGNDAAVTLARFHSGSVEDFVAEMNQRAQDLGLSETSYQNPAGLDAPTQKSSPRDLSWLAMFVMRKPEIAERMGRPSMLIRSTAGTNISLLHTHQMLRADETQEFIAGKTGTTDAAGQCLLSIVEAGGRRYIAVLLHSKDRYADTRAILPLLFP